MTPISLLEKLRRVSTFWLVVLGSLALHALVLLVVWRLPAAPNKAALRPIEVVLNAPTPVPPKQVAVVALAPTVKRAKRINRVKRHKPAAPVPIAARPTPRPRRAPVEPRPRPVATARPIPTPPPSPIATIPPPRERTTPIIAPTTAATSAAPVATTIPDLTPLPNPQPASPVAGPTAQANPTDAGKGLGQGEGKGAGKGSGEGTGRGVGKNSGDGNDQGQGDGDKKGEGSGNGTGEGQGDGKGDQPGEGNGGGGSGGAPGGDGGGQGDGKKKGGGSGPYGLPASGEAARNIVYVLDVSPSMKDRIARAEAELSAAMERLVPGERFNIVAFDAKTYPFQKQLVPATALNLARARQFLDDLKLDVQEERGNGTNLQLALRVALQTKGVNAVVIVTDGEPTVGERNYATIARKARSLNANKARIDAVGLTGNYPDGTPEEFPAKPLLEQIARENSGVFKAVQDE